MVTYESIIMNAQQQMRIQHEAQKKAAETEAMERAMRMRALAEHQRQLARLDGQGNQPRRF